VASLYVRGNAGYQRVCVLNHGWLKDLCNAHPHFYFNDARESAGFWQVGSGQFDKIKAVSGPHTPTVLVSLNNIHNGRCLNTLF